MADFCFHDACLISCIYMYFTYHILLTLLPVWRFLESTCSLIPSLITFFLTAYSLADYWTPSQRHSHINYRHTYQHNFGSSLPLYVSSLSQIFWNTVSKDRLLCCTSVDNLATNRRISAYINNDTTHVLLPFLWTLLLFLSYLQSSFLLFICRSMSP